MSSDEGGFFSRWSRRKSEVRSGAAVPAEAPIPSGTVTRQAVTPPTATAPVVVGSAPGAEPAPAGITAQPLSPASPAAAPEPPPLTLDDVRQLTPDADFTPFVARDVAPEVRNAAFKKLFADPKFNVMDGLDIYIDDYSKPDPLPASLARQLVSARSLGLFDEAPASTAAPAAGGTDAVASPIDPPPGADVADPNPDTPTSTDIEPPVPSLTAPPTPTQP